MFFEEHSISYSYILFIKYYVLRSFYIKLLCFSKIVFSRFSIDRICFSIDRKCDLNFVLNLTYSISVGSIESDFQSVESIFRSIKNRIESFLKPLFLTRSNTISKLSKVFLSLFDQSKIPSKIFVIFTQISSRVFVL